MVVAVICSSRPFSTTRLLWPTTGRPVGGVLRSTSCLVKKANTAEQPVAMPTAAPTPRQEQPIHWTEEGVEHSSATLDLSSEVEALLCQPAVEQMRSLSQENSQTWWHNHVRAATLFGRGAGGLALIVGAYIGAHWLLTRFNAPGKSAGQKGSPDTTPCSSVAAGAVAATTKPVRVGPPEGSDLLNMYGHLPFQPIGVNAATPTRQTPGIRGSLFCNTQPAAEDSIPETTARVEPGNNDPLASSAPAASSTAAPRPLGWWRTLPRVHYLNFGADQGLLPQVQLNPESSKTTLIGFEDSSDAEFVAATFKQALLTPPSAGSFNPTVAQRSVRYSIPSAKPHFLEDICQLQGCALDILPMGCLQKDARLTDADLSVQLVQLLTGRASLSTPSSSAASHNKSSEPRQQAGSAMQVQCSFPSAWPSSQQPQQPSYPPQILLDAQLLRLGPGASPLPSNRTRGPPAPDSLRVPGRSSFPGFDKQPFSAASLSGNSGAGSSTPGAGTTTPAAFSSTTASTSGSGSAGVRAGSGTSTDTSPAGSFAFGGYEALARRASSSGRPSHVPHAGPAGHRALRREADSPPSQPAADVGGQSGGGGAAEGVSAKESAGSSGGCVAEGHAAAHMSPAGSGAELSSSESQMAHGQGSAAQENRRTHSSEDQAVSWQQGPAIATTPSLGYDDARGSAPAVLADTAELSPAEAKEAEPAEAAVVPPQPGARRQRPRLGARQQGRRRTAQAPPPLDASRATIDVQVSAVPKVEGSPLPQQHELEVLTLGQQPGLPGPQQLVEVLEYEEGPGPNSGGGHAERQPARASARQWQQEGRRKTAEEPAQALAQQHTGRQGQQQGWQQDAWQGQQPQRQEQLERGEADVPQQGEEDLYLLNEYYELESALANSGLAQEEAGQKLQDNHRPSGPVDGEEVPTLLSGGTTATALQHASARFSPPELDARQEAMLRMSVLEEYYGLDPAPDDSPASGETDGAESQADALRSTRPPPPADATGADFAGALARAQHLQEQVVALQAAATPGGGARSPNGVSAPGGRGAGPASRMALEHVQAQLEELQQQVARLASCAEGTSSASGAQVPDRLGAAAGQPLQKTAGPRTSARPRRFASAAEVEAEVNFVPIPDAPATPAGRDPAALHKGPKSATVTAGGHGTSSTGGPVAGSREGSPLPQAGLRNEGAGLPSGSGTFAVDTSSSGGRGRSETNTGGDGADSSNRGSGTERAWGSWRRNRRIESTAGTLLPPEVLQPQRWAERGGGSGSHARAVGNNGDGAGSKSTPLPSSMAAHAGLRDTMARTSTHATQGAGAGILHGKGSPHDPPAASDIRTEDGATIVSRRAGRKRRKPVQRDPAAKQADVRDALRLAAAEVQTGEQDDLSYDEASSPGNTQHTGRSGGQQQWWQQRYQALFLPTINYADGAQGFVQLDVSLTGGGGNARRDMRVVTFEDHHDCLHCLAVIKQWPEYDWCDMMAALMPTATLEQDIMNAYEAQGDINHGVTRPNGVVVFRRGKLSMRVGMSTEQFTQIALFQAAAQVSLGKIGYQFDDF